MNGTTSSATKHAAKTSLLVIGGMVAGVAGVSGQPAEDLSGTWVFSVDLGATGAGDATFVLTQDGGSLSGTYTGAVGEHEIHGSVSRDRVEIHFEVEEVGIVSYSGTITDEGIDGTCTYGELGSGTFRARRKP